MEILLVVPSLDILKFKGIAKVSYKLAKELGKKFDLEVYEAYEPSADIFSNLIKTPLGELLARARIVHATVPEAAAFLWLIKKFRNIKTLVTFHDVIPLEMDEKLQFRFKDLMKWYTFTMWKQAANCDMVIANSSNTAKSVERWFNRKVDYIINPGVDEKFKPIKIKKEELTLGFFSNFTYRKGADKAIEIFKLVKQKIDCKLILAGGEIQTFWQRQLNVFKITEGLKDIEIFGHIPEEEVIKLYNSFDFYLFPSQAEGFGLPILEAQACGVPTLIFDYAKIPKEVSKKAIKCKSVEDAANKIMKLTENKKEYTKIRKEGIKYAKKFSWKKFIKAHEKIYDKLLN